LFEGHNIILYTGFFPYFLGICNESRKTNNIRPTSLPEDTRTHSTTTHSRDHVALYSYWTAWTEFAVTYGCDVPCCHLPIEATFYIRSHQISVLVLFSLSHLFSWNQLKGKEKIGWRSYFATG